MAKIVAFTGSNSSQSINQNMLEIAKKANPEADITILDIRTLEAPIYSIDIEKNSGIPSSIQELLSKLKEFDAYLISIPEHNGMPPAFFKNIIDWLSRAENGFFGNKPVGLLSASPGGLGGANNLERTKGFFKYWGGDVTGTFSVPSYFDKLNTEDNSLPQEDMEGLKNLVQSLNTVTAE